jgi:para-nitrobenzyl esterase
MRRVAPRVPLLLTHTRDDARPFLLLPPQGRRLHRLGSAGRLLGVLLGRAGTARFLGRPARRLAEQWRAAGGQARVYRLDWSPRDAPFGAAHCIDLPLLFGYDEAWRDAPMLGTAASSHSGADGQALRRAWTAFAVRGEYPVTSAAGGLTAL